ncbi:uncharacterized protein SCHCODRAFT_02619828 [Schizophyllum commune H4-8]|nr:uncharacterized protein SCHCODRAFT_02619828 [Schizophyllum commune H4-8]KAI5895584.1 hypothetical protein SCHCODRAFT_02619828 [Schizophyllum commune H4-8]
MSTNPTEGAINDLPPEILGEIFIHCTPRDDLTTDKNLLWVSPSQVCRSWRQAALSCHRFWAQAITFAQPFWTYTTLRRAASAPLTFKIDLDRIELDYAVTIVALHIQRTRELVLTGADVEVYRFLKHFAQEDSEAPLLEVIHLDATNWRSPLEEGSMYHLPNIFPNPQCIPSRMRVLELISCMLPTTSGVYTNLTTLRLCRPPPPRDLFGTLFALLGATPNLDTLTIEELCVLPVGWPTRCPRLANLTYKCSDDSRIQNELNAFLSLLGTLDPTQTRNVTAHVFEPKDIYAVLKHRIPFGTLPVQLHIQEQAKELVKVVIAPHEATNAPCTFTLQARIRRGANGDFLPDHQRTQLVRETVTLLGHLPITSVCVQGFHDIARCVIRDLDALAALGSVTHWKIHGTPPPPLLLEAALLRRMLSIGFRTRFYHEWEIRDADGGAIQIFPALSCIEIVGVDFQPRMTGMYGGAVVTADGILSSGGSYVFSPVGDVIGVTGDVFAPAGPDILHLIFMLVWASAERRRLKVLHSCVPKVIITDCRDVDAGIVYAMQGFTKVQWDGKGASDTKYTEFEDVRSAVLSSFAEMFVQPVLQPV